MPCTFFFRTYDILVPTLGRSIRVLVPPHFNPSISRALMEVKKIDQSSLMEKQNDPFCLPMSKTTVRSGTK